MSPKPLFPGLMEDGRIPYQCFQGLYDIHLAKTDPVNVLEKVASSSSHDSVGAMETMPRCRSSSCIGMASSSSTAMRYSERSHAISSRTRLQSHSKWGKPSARPVSFSALTRMQSHAIGAMFRQDRLRYRYHSPQQTRAPDFCKAHDSSKRCRFEDGSGQPCTKSAQGRTDFCKADAN